MDILLKCLKYSSKEQIKKVEKILGCDIARDKDRSKNKSHVNDGDDQNWKKHPETFTDANLKKIESELNKFSISLADFRSSEHCLL